MTRFLYPILALVLIAATVAQVSANRATKNTAPAAATAAVQREAAAGVVAEGRLVSYPDAQVTIGSDAEGTVERLAVHEKDVVHRGDVIAVIRADDTRA